MKAVGAAVVCATFIMQVSQSATVRNKMTRCEEDHECSKSQFCYHTGYCAECIQCNIYHRVQPEYPSCTKVPLKCGSCLPGYEEELLVVESQRRDRCILAQTAKDEGEDYQFLNSSVIAYVIIGLLIFILICMLAISIYFWRTRKKECTHDAHTRDVNTFSESNQNTPAGVSSTEVSRGSRMTDVPSFQYEITSPSAPLLSTSELSQTASSSRNGNELNGYYPPAEDRIVLSTQNNSITYSRRTANEPPPPYENTSAPLLNKSGECREDEEEAYEMEIQMTYRQHKEDIGLEGTQPYQRPTFPYNNSSDNDNDGGGEEEEEDDGIPVGNISPPQLDEEETVADHWRPPENYGNVQETVDGAAGHDPEEEVINPVSDSGISDSSCQTSSASLSRPFAHLNSSESIPSIEEACCRGITRSHSDENVQSMIVTKRQRHDSGTQSLANAIIDEQ